MILIHDIYGRVVVDKEELNNHNDFLPARLLNVRDTLRPPPKVIGKAGLNKRGGYIEKDRPEIWIKDWMQMVKSCAYRAMSEGSEWEELVQVGYEGMLVARERFDPKKNNGFAAFAKPYVNGYISNFQNPTRNGKMNVVGFEDGVCEEAIEGNSLSVEDHNRNMVVLGAIAELTKKQRYVVEQHYIQGHTQQQVADILNINLRNTKKLLHRAKINLRLQLNEVFKNN